MTMIVGWEGPDPTVDGRRNNQRDYGETWPIFNYFSFFGKTRRDIKTLDK